MDIATALAAILLAAAATPMPMPMPMPGGSGGIGFDDLQFSDELHELIVPAGRTGRLDLVDPESGAVGSVAGFSAADRRKSGHGEGTTSADAGRGWVFAVDRTERTLAAVDPIAKRIVARAELAGAPDYVRWVAATGEVWVTEPGRKAIETFRLDEGSPPTLTRTGSISVPEAPESLVVDSKARRAYTNTFRDATFAIDLGSRSIAARWANPCRGARGLALDPARQLLFVGCEEGKVVSLDVAHGGSVAGEASTGTGVDSIAYSPTLRHLYAPADESANVTIVGVGARGELQALGAVAAAPEAHCAAADDRGNVYVCDPRNGRLLVFHDPYPASR
jgi:hypothetical protein